MAEVKTSPKSAARLGVPSAKEAAIIAPQLNSKSPLTMVDMKGAVKTAIAFIEGFFPEATDILLEEVELKQGHYENSPSEGRTYKQHPFWRVVLSFKSGKPGTLSEVMGGDPRLFREVKVERDSGEIHSMVTWGQ